MMKTLRKRPHGFNLLKIDAYNDTYTIMSFSELENEVQGVKCRLSTYANDKIIKHDVDYLYLDTDPYSIDTDVSIFDGEAPDEKFNPLAYFDITKSIFYKDEQGYHILSEVIEVQEDYRDWYKQSIKIELT